MPRSLPLLIFLILTPLISASGGEVTLKNGDRISGTIIKQSEEVIELQTTYAGVIKIERKYVAKLSGADGKEPEERPAPPAANETVGDTEPQPVGTIVPASPPSRKDFGDRFKVLFDGWEGNANVGFSYTAGNSNNTTMTTGLRALKTIGNDKLTVYVRSLWNSNRGSGRMITTQNAFWGGGRYDRRIHHKTFGFISYDFERDRPKKLNFRSVAGGGVGYHFVRTEQTEIDILGGAAWNRTWLPGPNTDTPEALAGTTFKHKFNDRLRIQKAFTYFQNVSDFSTFRFLFDASLTADVTKRIGVFVTIGDRFNNDPAGAAKKNDFLFTTGLKWNFGKKK